MSDIHEIRNTARMLDPDGRSDYDQSVIILCDEIERLRAELDAILDTAIGKAISENKRLRADLGECIESHQRQNAVVERQDDEIERLRAEIERQKIFLQLYRSGDFLGDAKMLLVRAAYESGEISGERASELLGESRQVFQERGWMQGDGIEETRAEIERLRGLLEPCAFRQYCKCINCQKRREALGDE